MNRLIHPPSDPVHTFSAHHPPLATVHPGETIVIETLDAFHNRITSESDRFSEKAAAPYVDPVTGPIVIEGAQKGDALRVTIHAIEPTRDHAVTGLVPDFGGLTRTPHTPMLHDPLPEVVRLMPIRDGEVHFSRTIRFPLRPFLGTIGVAPELEAISTLAPDRHGGNMDCAETAPGRTLMFPVFNEGGYFFCGDAHAAQGDGELTGVAAEIPARVTLTFDLDKGRAPAWPRIESDAELMAIGSARPMEDAARIAWTELIDWLVADHGFERLEAYQLLGQVGTMRVGNMVNPNYTMVARVRKAFLQPSEPRP